MVCVSLPVFQGYWDMDIRGGHSGTAEHDILLTFPLTPYAETFLTLDKIASLQTSNGIISSCSNSMTLGPHVLFICCDFLHNI